MFDLETIEQDWKNNSFKLSEEDIINIYKKEYITQADYNKQLKKFTIPPKPKKLSIDKQKIVVEGCMDIVFEETRNWYMFFSKKISLEEIYYLVLESLIKTVSMTIHSEKKDFKECIRKRILVSVSKYYANINEMDFKSVYQDILYYKSCKMNYEIINENENVEIPEKPETVNYLNRNIPSYVDYSNIFSSIKFMEKYEKSLEILNDLERKVMSLTFDEFGNRLLTMTQIAEYLGISFKKVSYTRKKAYEKIKRTFRRNNII